MLHLPPQSQVAAGWWTPRSQLAAGVGRDMMGDGLGRVTEVFWLLICYRILLGVANTPTLRLLLPCSPS